MAQSGAQKRQRGAETKKDLSYYLTLFKIEGHTTWRAHLAADPQGFAKQCQPGMPKITEKKTVRIDRITGLLHVV